MIPSISPDNNAANSPGKPSLSDVFVDAARRLRPLGSDELTLRLIFDPVVYVVLTGYKQGVCRLSYSVESGVLYFLDENSSRIFCSCLFSR